MLYIQPPALQTMDISLLFSPAARFCVSGKFSWLSSHITGFLHLGKLPSVLPPCPQCLEGHCRTLTEGPEYPRGIPLSSVLILQPCMWGRLTYQRRHLLALLHLGQYPYAFGDSHRKTRISECTLALQMGFLAYTQPLKVQLFFHLPSLIIALFFTTLSNESFHDSYFLVRPYSTEIQFIQVSLYPHISDRVLKL